jgi:hypothetical protein
MGILSSKSNDFAIAQRMIANQQETYKSIVNAGTLHYDDYKDLSEDVVKSREFLNVGVQDLIGAGLSQATTINNTIVQYQTMNTFDAQVSMDGSNRKTNQTDYDVNWLPLPIYHTDFTIPWRQEGFSYKESDGVQESVFRVNELQDQVLFNGASLGVKVSGVDAPLYGYTNHPNTITSTISDWTVSTNYDKISQETVGLVGELFVGGRVMEPNSVMMYVATDIWSSMQQDYSTAKGDRTVLERLRAISEIADVKPQKDLASKACVLVEMRPRTVQLAVATMPIAVPWVKGHDLEDGRFTVYSSMVAKIKADRTGKAGIIYATTA